MVGGAFGPVYQNTGEPRAAVCMNAKAIRMQLLSLILMACGALGLAAATVWGLNLLFDRTL